jgi:hypothetical protein
MAPAGAGIQASADREHHGGDPAGRLELVQIPEIEDQRRRDAEIDEIGETVELGAEPRRALEHARDAPVDAVEHGRKHDGAERDLEPAFDREPDGGQSGAQRQQGDQVGHQRAHRDRPEAAPPRRTIRLEGWEQGIEHEANIAISRPSRHGAAQEGFLPGPKG